MSDRESEYAPGDVVKLRTDTGRRDWCVVGVISEQGHDYHERRTYRVATTGSFRDELVVTPAEILPPGDGGAGVIATLEPPPETGDEVAGVLRAV